MENKNKNRNFIVFQFNVRTLLDEQKAILNKGYEDLWENFGYFEELVLDPEVKSKDLLDNDLILLFVDPQHFKAWLWEDCNTTTRMKAVAEKKSLLIREKYGTDLPKGVIPYFYGNLKPHIPRPPLTILRCPSCGSKKIKIRKEEYPLCVRCGYSGGDFMSSYPR